MQELCRTIAPLTYLAIIFPSKLGFDLVALDYGQLTQNISWTNGIFCIYWNSEFHSRRESIKEGNFSYHPLGGVISPIFGEHPPRPKLRHLHPIGVCTHEYHALFSYKSWWNQAWKVCVPAWQGNVLLYEICFKPHLQVLILWK